MTERMNINMEQLEAVSGGTLPFGPDDMDGCEHPDYTFSDSTKEEGGVLYQWGHCIVCSWNGWVQVFSKAEGTKNDLFAPAAKK